jgi:hypothetical protein
MDNTQIQNKTISEIAYFVSRDWSKRSPLHEVYLSALRGVHCVNIRDNQNNHYMYGSDSAQSVVLYFLCNASAYRGDNAKMVKAELKRRLRESGYLIK